MSCRGRDRTFTEKLAQTQRLVVNPGRPNWCYVGSMFSLSFDLHPRDERACLPKFHHPTVCKELFAFAHAILSYIVHSIEIFQVNFLNFRKYSINNYF